MLFKQALDKEKADKLHQELDMRPERRRMKTMRVKLMKKSTANVEGGGVYEIENFEEKPFELFPNGPVCKAFMQRAENRSEHVVMRNFCWVGG